MNKIIMFLSAAFISLAAHAGKPDLTYYSQFSRGVKYLLKDHAAYGKQSGNRIELLNKENQVIGYSYTTEFMDDKELTNNFRCPKIERPDDPRYMTRAQDKADRAKKNVKKASKAKAKAKAKAKTSKAEK